MLNDDLTLPPLRQELKLEPSEPDANGRPRWKIYDPFMQRVYILGKQDIELLADWSVGTVGALKARWAKRQKALDEGELAELLEFLHAHFLVKNTEAQRAEKLTELAKKTRSKWLDAITPGKSKRVPIWDPNPMINELMPVFLWIGPKAFFAGWLLMTLLGFYLVAQEWDQFLATFLDFFSFSGLALYVITLIAVKFAHEFGHAFTAVYHQCRVGKVSLTLFMGLPLLSTELNDTERLDNNRQRALISAGGLMVETAIASIALVAWAILPEGSVKGLMFVVATTIWITSLLINLNIFSRFDGYYILSDLIAIENLQPRALAFTRWEFERLVWGQLRPSPEQVSYKVGSTLFLYGVAVWCYQILIFCSIAILFYLYVSQALGLVLFAFALGRFLVKPLFSFFQTGWQERKSVSRPRLWGMSLTLFTLGLLCFIPLSQHVHVPAMLGWSNEHVVQVQEESRIEYLLPHGSSQRVEEGQVIYRFQSPELTAQLRKAHYQRQATQQRLSRIGGSAEELAQRIILQEELEEITKTIEGLQERRDRLNWTAPVEGFLVDVPHTLANGQWVRPDSNLGRIISGRELDAVGYIPETQLNRLQTGVEAVFYPDEPSRELMLVKLAEVEEAAAERIVPEALSSNYGGAINTHQEQGSEDVPVEAQHRARFQVITRHFYPTPSTIRGTIILKAEPESLANRTLKRIWQLWLREIQQ